MKKIVFVLTLCLFTFLSAGETFYFFYSHKCPHCKDAYPFIDSLKKKFPELEIKKMEIAKNSQNREICRKKVDELKILGFGVPLFIIGKDYVVGFRKGSHEKKIKNMIKKNIGKKKKSKAKLKKL